MSFVSDVFTKTAVLVPKKSGFNQDSEHLFTTYCGILTPCFVLETLPNSDYSIGCNFDVKLPPLASDFYGKVDACIELFWVSNRALYGGWPEFATLPKFPGRNGTNYGSDGITVNGSRAPMQKRNPVGFNADSLVTTGDHQSGDGEDARTETFINVPNPAGYANPVAPLLPYIGIPDTDVPSQCGPCSLADYLGVKISGATPGVTFTINNPFPFLAYHRIWDKYYRCSQLESPAFIKPAAGDPLSFKSLPWQRMTTQSSLSKILNDGENIMNLRRRKFALDYFTSATPTPWGLDNSSDSSFTHRQDGRDPQAVTIESILHGDSETGDSVFGLTIPMLRAANTLQQFLEQRQLSGTWKFREQVGRLYGGKPMDLDLEPRFLGRLKTNIYNNSISQTSQTDGNSSESGAFSGLQGNSVARPVGGANGSLCNFHSEEWGILMAIFSLVPHAYYSTGTDKMFMHSSMYDYADALLQNLGVQPIHQYEICDFLGYTSMDNSYKVFGYTKPYAEWMYKKDYVSGLFRDSQNLDYMCLQRSFGSASNPVINSSFVEIPEDYMDQVAATTAKVSEFGCMVDAFFPCKTVLPLQKFIIPTLGTPEFMSTAIVNNRHTHM